MHNNAFNAARQTFSRILLVLALNFIFSVAKSAQSMLNIEPTSLSANELIEIVDETNNVLQPQLRHVMRSQKLIHRATYALLRTSHNYFYVQKRSSIKDYCPSFFDPTPGGVVAAGESYELTNRREIEEEMGVKDTPCQHLFTFYYEDNRIRCYGDAWEVVYDGPLRLQRTEVQSVHMMSMKEILDRAESGESFTPDSIFACKEYVRLFGVPIPSGERPNRTFTFDDL